MKKLILFILTIVFLAALSNTAMGQSFNGITWDDYNISGDVYVSSGNKNLRPDTSAAFQIGKDTATKGLLLPRVVDTVVYGAKKGLLIYRHLDNKMYFYNGTSWTQVGGGSSGGSGADSSIFATRYWTQTNFLEIGDSTIYLTPSDAAATYQPIGSYLTSEVDGSTTNELQTLSIPDPDSIQISGGNKIGVPWLSSFTETDPDAPHLVDSNTANLHGYVTLSYFNSNIPIYNFNHPLYIGSGPGYTNVYADTTSDTGLVTKPQLEAALADISAPGLPDVTATNPHTTNVVSSTKLRAASNTDGTRYNEIISLASTARWDTLPDANGTFVMANATQTVTGKTMSGANNTFFNFNASTLFNTGTVPAARLGSGSSSTTALFGDGTFKSPGGYCSIYVSSNSSETITMNYSHWVFNNTGAPGAWDVLDPSMYSGRCFSIVNASGAFDLTLNGGGSWFYYNGSTSTSYTLNAGPAKHLVSDGTYWYIF